MATRANVTALLLGCLCLSSGLGGAASDSDPTGLDAEVSTLAMALGKGSDPEATAALCRLDAKPQLFLDNYELFAEAAMSATGSLDRDGLADIADRYRFLTPFRELADNRRAAPRRELLASWMGVQIRQTPYSARKQEVLGRFSRLVKSLLALRENEVCRANLLAAFRYAIYYRQGLFVIPEHGGDLAINFYLEYLDDPDQELRGEVFTGLSMMGFLSPRQEAIRQILLKAYPECAGNLTPANRMCLEVPPCWGPVSEEEYVKLQQMTPAELGNVLRVDPHAVPSSVRVRIAQDLLCGQAEQGVDAAYDELFRLLAERPCDGYNEMAHFLARTPKAADDQERLDRLWGILEGKLDTFIRENRPQFDVIAVLRDSVRARLETAKEDVLSGRMPENIQGANQVVDMLLEVMRRSSHLEARTDAASLLAEMCWVSADNTEAASVAIEEELKRLDEEAASGQARGQGARTNAKREELKEALAEVGLARVAFESISRPSQPQAGVQ